MFMNNILDEFSGSNFGINGSDLSHKFTSHEHLDTGFKKVRVKENITITRYGTCELVSFLLSE